MGSEPKFTKGPWEVPHFARNDVQCDCTGIVCEGYAGAIADVLTNNGKPIGEGGNDSPPLEEAVANAHLIAAAPDLFEALMVATREIEYTARDLADSCCLLRDGVRDLTTAEPEDRAEIERLRGLHGQMNAAIAKATGGKP